ncbi:MAG: hypothetical protein OXI38_06545, partial [Bacteroidota bacterium]|nr:hypothetical protein [Bacteroidota bacterium]
QSTTRNSKDCHFGQRMTIFLPISPEFLEIRAKRAEITRRGGKIQPFCRERRKQAGRIERHGGRFDPRDLHQARLAPLPECQDPAE